MNRLIIFCRRIFVTIVWALVVVYTSAQIPTGQNFPNPTTARVNPVPSPYSSSVPVNFVRSWNALRPLPDEATLTSTSRTKQEVSRSTQYADGLGRPLQNVDWQVSPAGKDMVTPFIYDAFGRETFKYLPYTSTTNDGAFKLNAFTEQNSFMSAFYNPTNNVDGERFFYNKIDFEASPLSRPLNKSFAGNSWSGNGLYIKYYETNALSDSIRIWTITSIQGSMPSSPGVYNTGELYRTRTINGDAVEETVFTDKQGRIIAKRETSGSGPSRFSKFLFTYYIYDDLGNLRYVIQPKGAVKLRNNGWAFDGTTWQTSTIAKELAFSYEYDSRNRQIIKRIPGSGEAWMVYDARDRLVMTQDSVDRVNGRWQYVQYDSLNRPVLTGLWSTTGDRSYHQNLAASSVSYPSPASGYTISTQTYYDNYNWVSGTGSGLSSALITANGITGTSYFYTASNTSFPYPQAIAAGSAIRGSATGTKTRVLGTSTFLYTVNFYDDRQRLIQVHSINYTGGKDTVTTQYSFTGQVLRTLVCHQKAGTNAQQYRILTKMEYDAGGRLVKAYKKTGNSPEVTIIENKYDELGQLQKKYIGKTRNSGSQNVYTATAIDSLKYDYNIRGWLRGINKDYARNENGANNWFGEELNYDYGFTQTYLNSNIAGIRWRSKGDDEQRAYGFTYDFVNRLAKANFTQLTNAVWNISAGIDFTLIIGDGSGVNSPVYDENGNFLSLMQKGLKLNSSVTIDSLTYSYNTNSNKLNYVTDSKNDVNTVLGDFKEINNNSTQDYWYDGNGNLTKDLNKNISAICYTHLNMPDSIAITGKGYIRYVYDANGVKLRKWVVDQTVTPNKITNTLYLGPFTYINDTLQYISQEEGRIRPKRAGYSDTMYYDYFEKDHLGNTRVVLTDELQKDMYPVASLETTPLNNEKIYYDRLDSGRVNKSTVPGYPNDTYTSPNDYIQKLRGNAVKVGASTLLKVMSGDKITVRVNSWYNLNGVTPTTPLSPLTDIVLALSGDIPATSAGKILASQVGGTVLNPQVTSFLNSRDASNTATNPKAYLNIVLLDEQLNPVITTDGKNSFFKQVSTNNSQETLSVTDREITKNGYVYIYVSNETPNVDVFFDNLQVTQTRGPLLEETHYYPFGLTMAGISSKAAGKIENRFKYNGIEEIGDFDLQDYDAQYRELDPQIGRWWEVDPKTDAMESWSPYASNYDNPITFKDPLGDAPGDPDDEAPHTEHFHAATRNEYKESPWRALAVDAGWFLANLTGAAAVDDAVTTFKDEKASTTDKVLAVLNVGFATTRGEGGHLSENFGEGGEMIGGGEKLSPGNKGGKGPNEIGSWAEKATGMDKPGEKQSFEGASGTMREADKMTKTTVHETKNVKYQHLSTQIKDYIKFASDKGQKFILWLRGDTKVSKQLQEQINNGAVKRKKIPGT